MVKPETYTLSPFADPLEIPRLITGLWQLSEGHSGHAGPRVGVDVAEYALAIREYVKAGLDCFDAADHYGPAEQVLGHYHTTHPALKTLTKWCPAPEVVGSEACAEAVDKAIQHVGVPTLDLLQYHVWQYEDPSYLTNLYYLSQLQQEGKIKHLGVTNMDLLHLRMLKASGYHIATNQVSVSVLDRRAETGGLAAWCDENGVGLLAYGTLLGGFVSEKWVGQDEPKVDETWSLAKYRRFIHAAGGWDAFQTVLAALDKVARKHGVKIATVATRYVLDIPGVAAVIVGTHLDARRAEYIAANLAAFELVLDDEDRTTIAKAQGALQPIPGDCGDEYRFPPYLTATGDLSHHLKRDTKAQQDIEKIIKEGGRVERSSGSPWEPICGYCRAVRIGDTFEVAGTTTRAHPSGTGVIGGDSVADQTTNVMDIIKNAIHGVGARMSDITRTRIFISDVKEWRGVAEVHGATMRHYGIRPVNTMVGGNTLIGDGILVEVEAMGIVRRDATA